MGAAEGVVVAEGAGGVAGAGAGVPCATGTSGAADGGVVAGE
ncbi:MAG: hypothetical protein U1E36_02060 [Rickettsiales bacterium]